MFLCGFIQFCMEHSCIVSIQLFLRHFVMVLVVHTYSNTDTIDAWKKSSFLLPNRSDFNIIDNLSVAVKTLARRILTSFSVDEMFLWRYVNWSNFEGYLLNVFRCWLIYAIQLGFCLGSHCFCRISPPSWPLFCLKTYIYIYSLKIYIYIYIYIYIKRSWLIGPVGRVFANDPGDVDSIPGHVIPKTLKNVTWYLLA